MLRWILKFSTAIIVFLAVLFLPGIIVLLCIEAECRGRGGDAPQADFETRRAWGEKLYKPYLEHMDSWAARSALIQSDIGEVQRIAPIGFNHYQGGFTDGANAKMNLEVVGERGKGILHLPYVEIFSDGQLNNIGADATWTCNGKTEVIVKSGKSYLAHLRPRGRLQKSHGLGWRRRSRQLPQRVGQISDRRRPMPTTDTSLPQR